MRPPALFFIEIQTRNIWFFYLTLYKHKRGENYDSTDTLIKTLIIPYDTLDKSWLKSLTLLSLNGGGRVKGRGGESHIKGMPVVSLKGV